MPGQTRPLCLGLSLAFFSAGAASAGDAGPDPVVVQVGASEVRAGELRFLLGRLHPFEQKSFGTTPNEVRRAFLQKRLVPELLLAEEAKRQRVPERPVVTAKVRSALAQALKEELERSFDAKLTSTELESYCKSSSPDAGDELCSGDLSGYRVALRRQRASAELERLARELREQHVKTADYALLARFDVRTDEASGPAPTASQEKPEP